MPGKSVQIGPFVGGLNTFSDPAAVADNELVECVNFELDLDGSLRSRPPFSDYGIDFPLGSSGNMLMLGYFYNNTGGALLIASDGANSTYYFDGTSWGLITNTFAASSMAQYNDAAYLLAPAGTGNPGGTWDGGTFTALSTMPHGDMIVVFKDRMWIAMGKDATSHGNRMFWSNTLVDTELWPTAPNYVDIGSGDGQNIVSLIVQYNTLLVFRSHSVWSFQYTADPKQAAQFLVVPGVGLAHKFSVVQFESYIYWMYEDRAYQYINNRALQLNMKVLFRSTASISDYYLPFAVSEFNRRIIFSYYDTMYVFSLKTRTWTTWSSDAYGGIGKIIKKENAPNIQAVAHSSELVPAPTVRTNLATDPAATTVISGSPATGVLGWSNNKWAGGAGSSTYTPKTDTVGAPVPGLTTYIRKQWTVASNTSTGDSGFQHSGSGTHGMPVSPGDQLSLSSYVRTNTTGKNISMFVYWYDSAGTQIGNGNRIGTKVLGLGSTWTRIGGVATAPAGAAYAGNISTTIESDSTPWGIGNTLDGTGLLIERASTLSSYFDGSLADTDAVDYAWVGTANASTSTAGTKRTTKTLLIKDELGTDLETFSCRITTKNYDYQVSSAYKRLFWWGADASFEGSITGWAVPISYNSVVTWGGLLAKGVTWGALAAFSWSKPQSSDLSVISTRDTVGTNNGRKFIKFPQSLRFRQINFQMEFTSDGTAASAVRLFSLTTFIKPKEHVSTAVS